MVAILFANSSCLSFDSIQSQIWWLKSHNPNKNVIHSCMHKSAHLHTIRMSITDFAKSLVLNCYKLMLCVELDTFSIIIVSKSFILISVSFIIMIEISFTFFVLFFIVFHQLRVLQKTSSRMTVTSLMRSAGRKTFRIFLDPEFSSFLLI